MNFEKNITYPLFASIVVVLIEVAHSVLILCMPNHNYEIMRTWK